MSLKESIKTKICLVNITSNYPLLDFVKWAENIGTAELLRYLDIIQDELDKEERLLKQICPSDGVNSYQILQGYWCVYCSQVRAYYRALARDPLCKTHLSFLL